MAVNAAVQESLLAILLFQEQGGLVSDLVESKHYENFYRRIAEKGIAYWRKWKRAPGEHALDIIESLCEKHVDDKKIYLRIYDSLLEIKDAVNTDYVLTTARTFVRQQRFKSAVVDISPLVNSGTDEDLDKAEQTMAAAMKASLPLFDAGTRLNDLSSILRAFESEVEAFPLGIKPLDIRQLGPARRELHLFIAPPKKGKTWWLVNMAKYAMLNRLRVVHVTLEMSEKRMLQRYIQSLFSISKRSASHTRMAFDENEHGRFVSMEELEIPTRPSFQDGAKNKLKRAIGLMGGRLNLIIKQFPTGGLTIHALNAYLDGLESMAGFIPDLLIVDYADLMQIDSKYYRHELGRIVKELRGIGVERNIAVASASQSNKEGAKSKTVRATHAGEDFSKIATADIVMTYSQTESEKKLGLARILVDAARNEEDGYQCLISQNYALGQFCMDAVRMSSKYWEEIKSKGENDGD